LDDCSLTAAGARPILEAVCGHRGLEVLSIGGNTAGSVAMTAAMELLSSNGGSLRRLNLEGNGLRDRDVEKLAGALREDPEALWVRVGYHPKGLWLGELRKLGRERALREHRDPLDQAFIDTFVPPTYGQ